MSDCCIICYRFGVAEMAEPQVKVGKESGSVEKRFFKLFQRYLDHSTHRQGRKNRLTQTIEENNGSVELIYQQALRCGMTTCWRCRKLMESFCELYHQWKCGELLLDWKIMKLKEALESGRKKPRLHFLNKRAKHLAQDRMNGSQLLNRIKKLNAAFIERCSKNPQNSVPVVTLGTSKRIDNNQASGDFLLVGQGDPDGDYFKEGYPDSFQFDTDDHVSVFSPDDIEMKPEICEIEMDPVTEATDSINYDFVGKFNQRMDVCRQQQSPSRTISLSKLKKSGLTQTLVPEKRPRGRPKGLLKRIIGPKIKTCPYTGPKIRSSTTKADFLSADDVQVKFLGVENKNTDKSTGGPSPFIKVEEAGETQEIQTGKRSQRVKKAPKWLGNRENSICSDEDDFANSEIDINDKYDKKDSDYIPSTIAVTPKTGKGERRNSKKNKRRSDYSECATEPAIKVPKKRGRKPKSVLLVQSDNPGTDFEKEESQGIKKPRRRFRCPECSFTHRYLYGVLQHHKEVHNSEGAAQSGELGNIITVDMVSLLGGNWSSRASEFSIYGTIRIKDALFPCTVADCKVVLHSPVDMHSHLKLHGSFPCTACKHYEEYAPNLSLHERTHIVEDKNSDSKSLKFQCLRCSQSFQFESEYLQHHISKHLSLDFVEYGCAICSKTFHRFSKQRAYMHYKTHHNLRDLGAENEQKCCFENCNAYFMTEGQLRNHQMNVHQFDMKDDEAYKARKKENQKCNICGKGFHSNCQLKIHRKKMHSSILQLLVCNLDGCTKKFETESDLNSHISVYHLQTKTKRCLECGEEVQSGHLFKLHMDGHKAEEGLLVCETCGKCFESKEQLKQHVGTHIPRSEWKFTCNVCNKKFRKAYRLQVHMVSHTQEKKFICNVCGKNYNYQHSLKVHESVEHGIGTCKKWNKPGRLYKRKPKCNQQVTENVDFKYEKVQHRWADN